MADPKVALSLVPADTVEAESDIAVDSANPPGTSDNWSLSFGGWSLTEISRGYGRCLIQLSRPGQEDQGAEICTLECSLDDLRALTNGVTMLMDAKFELTLSRVF